jgi:HD-GYP domain-containing protein (c-di-GMP phosphodiesterase class II)
MTDAAPTRPAPRLVVWIAGVGFALIAGVLGIVFVLLSWQAQSRLTGTVVEGLEVSQRRFADLERRRARERGLQAVALSESPTLKAALDTYLTEGAQGPAPAGLLATVREEATKLADLMAVPALALVDEDGSVLASAGPLASDWPTGARLPWLGVPEAKEIATARGERWYLASVVPLLLAGETIGTFLLASPLDDAYARAIAASAGADVIIVRDGRLIASGGPSSIAALSAVALPVAGSVFVKGDEWVVRRLSAVDSVAIYAVSAVASAAAATTSGMTRVILLVGAIGLLLAGGASWWLARTLARPIDELTAALARMVETRDLHQPLPRRGVSREMDALAATFDTLRLAVSQAEADSEAAYLGVVEALAAALDARDPYTAGHSQRVAEFSVLIGRHMGLSETDCETLRLGALLHDIGKIGISDAVLRKPGRLTDEEFDHIKLHPVLGARILRPLAFLAPHLPVVELHHERPDGRGYPHGLKGDAIPVFARIVHVTDAFDAITTARAYRPARSASEAMAELWRHVGTDFDPGVVQAMAAVWDSDLIQSAGERPAGATWLRPPSVGTLPFRARSGAPLPEVVG